MKWVEVVIPMIPAEKQSEDRFENPGNHSYDGPKNSGNDSDQSTEQSKEQTKKCSGHSYPNREGEQHDNDEKNGGRAGHTNWFFDLISKNHSYHV